MESYLKACITKIKLAFKKDQYYSPQGCPTGRTGNQEAGQAGTGLVTTCKGPQQAVQAGTGLVTTCTGPQQAVQAAT